MGLERESERLQEKLVAPTQVVRFLPVSLEIAQMFQGVGLLIENSGINMRSIQPGISDVSQNTLLRMRQREIGFLPVQISSNFSEENWLPATRRLMLPGQNRQFLQAVLGTVLRPFALENTSIRVDQTGLATRLINYAQETTLGSGLGFGTRWYTRGVQLSMPETVNQTQEWILKVPDHLKRYVSKGLQFDPSIPMSALQLGEVFGQKPDTINRQMKRGDIPNAYRQRVQGVAKPRWFAQPLDYLEYRYQRDRWNPENVQYDPVKEKSRPVPPEILSEHVGLKPSTIYKLHSQGELVGQFEEGVLGNRRLLISAESVAMYRGRLKTSDPNLGPLMSGIVASSNKETDE